MSTLRDTLQAFVYFPSAVTVPSLGRILWSHWRVTDRRQHTIRQHILASACDGQRVKMTGIRSSRWNPTFPASRAKGDCTLTSLIFAFNVTKENFNLNWTVNLSGSSLLLWDPINHSWKNNWPASRNTVPVSGTLPRFKPDDEFGEKHWLPHDCQFVQSEMMKP